MFSLSMHMSRPIQWLSFAAMLLGLSTVVHAQTVSHASHAPVSPDFAQPLVTSASGNLTIVGAGYLQNPGGVAVDTAGNVYIADTLGDRIQKVPADGSGPTTFAGQFSNPGFSGDNGPATSAQLNQPSGLAFDAAGNLYIADKLNNRIRMVAAATGNITTVAGNGTAGFSGDGGPATGAELTSPTGVALDASANLYIADSGNAAVRKVAAGTGTITTAAGIGGSPGYSGDGGAATSAQLYSPNSVALDSSGNLYIADSSDPSVRKVSVGGTISTVAGDGVHTTYTGDGGSAASSTLYPFGVAVDSNGNLYVACGNNANNNRVVKIAGGTITTVAGTGTPDVPQQGLATASPLNGPQAVAVDSSNNIYIADTGNNDVEKVTFAGTSTPTVTVTPASFSVTTAQTLTVAVVVSGGTGTATATGSVVLSGGGYTSPVTTLGSGDATITIAPGALAPGSDVLTVKYTPDTASSSIYSGATGTSPAVDVTAAVPDVTVSTSAASISQAQPLTVSIAVSDGSTSPTPTGSVTLSSGSYTSAATTLSSGNASIVVPGGSLGVGTVTLSVTYTPDSASSSIYEFATGMALQVVTGASNVTPTVTVTPSASSITTAQPLTISVVVGTASGKPVPTGTVTLASGTYTAPPATLANGSASFTLPAGALPLGADTITVSYAPDTAGSANYNSSSGTTQVTVSAPAKITPTVQVTPSATSITVAQQLSVAISVLGGDGNPATTGSVVLAGGGYTSAVTPLTRTAATITIPYGLLAIGDDTLTVSYTPDTGSASTYNSATGTTVVTVSTIPLSTPSVTITFNPPITNTGVPTTATVALSGTPSPSGTVILTGGSYTSSPATLSLVGQATFTIPAGALPAGVDTLSAAYTPDGPGSTVYNPVTGTATLKVEPAGDFVVSNSGSSITISPGATSGNTSAITITPAAGFVGQINLSCTVTTSLSIYTDIVTCGLGSGGTTTTSVAVNGSPVTTTLTVQSTAPAGTSTARSLNPFVIGGGAALAGVILFGIPARRRGWQMLFSILLLGATFGLTLGCSSNSSSSGTGTKTDTGTTPGPYLVTVTGVDAATGSLTSVNTVNVIVN